jgi:hypothetical protein
MDGWLDGCLATPQICRRLTCRLPTPHQVFDFIDELPRAPAKMVDTFRRWVREFVDAAWPDRAVIEGLNSVLCCQCV